MKRIFSVALCLTLFLTMVCACTKGEEDNAFFGTWEAYEQTSSNGVTIKFGEYEQSETLKLTISFTQEDYTIHYYVNGSQGNKYPQMGTYTFTDKTASLSNGMTAIIDGDKLTIVYYDEDNTVMQNYTRAV